MRLRFGRAEDPEYDQNNPALGENFCQKYGYTLAEVVWAVREEMALSVETAWHAAHVRHCRCPRKRWPQPESCETMARELGT